MHSKTIHSAKKFVLALLSVVAIQSMAVPISQIDIGDTYFIDNLMSENELVLVKRIDHERGLVKIQYTSGGIDWVSPSKLLTKSGLKKSETETAVMGTALVAGAIWAIFDPEGFRQAMNNSNSSARQNNYSAKKHQPENSINISAVPFEPVIEGEWSNENQEWIDWSEGILKSRLKKTVSIESVRTKNISFYSTGNRSVVLVEAVQTGRIGAYYLIAVRGGNNTVILDSNGTPIHKMNKMMGLSINTATEAKSYLKFFCTSISGDEGIFVVLEPDSDFLPKEILSKANIPYVQISGNASTGWKINADILYSGAIFNANFLVDRLGNVSMLDDTPKVDVNFDYNVVMDGARRIYVKQN